MSKMKIAGDFRSFYDMNVIITLENGSFRSWLFLVKII